ncbi:MAG: radical SAM protein [Candidatus Gastranaerophilaceae bacterium]
MTEKTTRVCHYHKLKICYNGDVYPCCLTVPHTFIGNIFDKDIFEKIKNAKILCECSLFKSVEQKEDDEINLKYIHYETSNTCQASCVCCYQSKEPMQNEKEHLARLRELIDYYKPENIVAIGGEVLVQENAFNMLSDLHKKYPKMGIGTISNLCVGEERLKQAEEIFDRITVSMLGFDKQSYKIHMNLDFEKVLNNFMTLYKNKKVELSPKFLAMPSNIVDIPEFLKWALTLDVNKIYLHNVTTFLQETNWQSQIWHNILLRIEKQIKNLFQDNKDLIAATNRHFISIHPTLAQTLNITEEYINSIGLEKNIFIAS